MNMKSLIFILIFLPVFYESKTLALACSDSQSVVNLRAISTFKRLDISDDEILQLSNGVETSASPKVMGLHEITVRCRITPAGKFIPNMQTTFDDEGIKGLTTLNHNNVEAKISFMVGKLRCNGIS